MRNPKAIPEWLDGIPVMKVTETGTKTIPTPRPRATSPGRMPVA